MTRFGLSRLWTTLVWRWGKWLSIPLGRTLPESFEVCESASYPICFDFGQRFRLALPCDVKSVKPEWILSNWEFSVDLPPFTLAGEPALIVTASERSERIVRIVYSYARGVVLFASIGSDTLRDGDGTYSVPSTFAVYVIEDGALGQSKNYCAVPSQE